MLLNFSPGSALFYINLKLLLNILSITVLPSLFYFDDNIQKKWLGSETKMKLDFLKIFDNPLPKYLIHKRVSWMYLCTIFWVLYFLKSERSLGRVSGAHFQQIFLWKVFLCKTLSIDQVSISELFYFSWH